MKHFIRQLLWPLAKIIRHFFYHLMRDVVDAQKEDNNSIKLQIDNLKTEEQRQFSEIVNNLELINFRLNAIEGEIYEHSAEMRASNEIYQTSISEHSELIKAQLETIESRVLECSKDAKYASEKNDIIGAGVAQTNNHLQEISKEVIDAIENVIALDCRTIHDVNKGFFELDFQRTHPSIKEKKSHEVYNEYFYNNNRYDSFTSARRVLAPIIKRLNIKSIIDFGCGTGTWLFAAKKLSVDKVRGIDGDYINRSMLLIDEDDFYAHDLTIPIDISEKYDLAISMEVGEHLPTDASSTFIKSICSSSDLVLFSAAHVGQGGDEHINEQPFSFWNRLFMENGYKHLEIRPFFSDDWEIESWYRENMGLFVKDNQFECTRNALSDIISEI